MVLGEKMALGFFKKPILHPILFALHPVVFLYAQNVDEVKLGDILAPAGMILLLTAGVYLFLKGLLKNEKKAAVIVSFLLVLVFSYEHLFPYFLGWRIANLISYKLIYLWWWSVFFAGVYLVVKSRRDLKKPTFILNWMAISLVFISVVNVVSFKSKNVFKKGGVENKNELETALLKFDAEEKPDIYYIIFDRYASESTLKEVFGYDNSDFVGYLAEKGFYVAGESYANYLITPQSMASSLNMRYINNLSQSVGENSSDRSPLHEMIEDSSVSRLLKKAGYRFVYIGNGAQPLSRNKFADVNLNLYPISEFSMMLYKTTIFYPVTGKFGILDERQIRWERVNFQLEKLEEIADFERPNFVYAHLLVPHDPYIFGENGELLAEDVVGERSREENYTNQVKFVNKRVRDLLEKILANKEKDSIVIIQSDEGPYPERFGVGGSATNWQTASSEELREKMGILNAYYFPGVEGEVFYPSITPVNSFRKLFNHYFDADLEILPDEHYIFEDTEHLYKLTNVTDKLKLNGESVDEGL